MEPILKIENVSKFYPFKKRIFAKDLYVKAVDGASFEVYKGETLGLVGESGCGKSTIARLILRLIEPTKGAIYLNGGDIFKSKGKARDEQRKQIGIVFQDPAASLDPKKTIRESLMRPLIVNGIKGKAAEDTIDQAISKINFSKELLDRLPKQLSGGQQQRASIARAIMLEPSLLVLDEPTSALDVSVQAQTLNVLLDLQQEIDLTYLFISHNLSVVRYVSDRICVMYLGKIMETAPTEELYSNPRHPYSFGLLSSAPPLHPTERNRRKHILTGELPSLVTPPSGCRFASRCAFKTEHCEQVEPEYREISPGHFISCHRYEELEF